jgi:hypothetical protein
MISISEKFNNPERISAANCGVQKKAIFILYFRKDIFFTFSPIYERNTTKKAMITNTTIFPVLSRKREVVPKKKLKEKTSKSIWFLENPISERR